MPKFKITLAEDHTIIHEVSEELVTIGRLPDNSLQIEDASVSSHHAELKIDGTAFTLVDLGSTNGTFVNDQAITSTVLKPGDRVRFGKIDAAFIDEHVESGGKQPLPSSEASEISLGTASARPVTFVSASPFPKSAKKGDALAMVSIVLAGLGALGCLGVLAMALGLAAPV